MDTLSTMPTRMLWRGQNRWMLVRMVARACIVLSCLSVLCSCGSDGPNLDALAVDAAQEVTSAEAPPEGRCGLTPRLLVSASTFPRPPSDAGNLEVVALELVANASDLYYVISAAENNGPLFSPILAGSVLRVPLGGGQPTLVASGFTFQRPVLTTTSVILGERNAYPNNYSDAIVSIPLDGGAPTTIVTLPDSLLAGPVTDGTYVYFTDQGGIEAVPLASGSTSPAPVTLASSLSAAIGVFGQRLLFFLPQGDVDSVSLPPESNCPVTTLGTSAAGPADVMPCGSDACWLGEGAEALMRIDPAGGPIAVMPLPSDLASPSNVVFDGVDFYIIDGEFGTTERLGRMSADGSASVILATMPAGGGGSVAVDDECIYWSNALGIFSLAKTAEGPFAQ